MELFLRQQFELLLQEATGNFAERLVHRSGGPEAALAVLRADSSAAAEFTANWFTENLLDGTGAAAFVLEALERREVPADPGGPIAEVLPRLARAAFAELLAAQTLQLIQRQNIYS